MSRGYRVVISAMAKRNSFGAVVCSTDAGKLHVRFNERGGKRSAFQRATAPFLDSTLQDMDSGGRAKEIEASG
jgi:hypothetical protein